MVQIKGSVSMNSMKSKCYVQIKFFRYFCDEVFGSTEGLQALSVKLNTKLHSKQFLVYILSGRINLTFLALLWPDIDIEKTQTDARSIAHNHKT